MERSVPVDERLLRAVFQVSKDMAGNRHEHVRLLVLVVPEGDLGALEQELARLADPSERAVRLDDLGDNTWDQLACTAQGADLLRGGELRTSERGGQLSWCPQKTNLKTGRLPR